MSANRRNSTDTIVSRITTEGQILIINIANLQVPSPTSGEPKTIRTINVKTSTVNDPIDVQPPLPIPHIGVLDRVIRHLDIADCDTAGHLPK
jgi:hypothetical protein